MPFEMVPKQTIDVENANRLLDMCQDCNIAINHLDIFLYNAEVSQTLSEEDLVKLKNIIDVMSSGNNSLWNFINDYIDRKIERKIP